MRGGVVRIVMVATLALVPILFVIQPASAAASIVLKPMFGVPGDTIGVTGTGFTDGSEVSVFLEEPPVGTLLVKTFITSRSGNIDDSFEIPNVEPGKYEVVACFVNFDVCISEQATATLTVLAPPPTTTSTTAPPTTTTTTSTTAPPTTTTTTLATTSTTLPKGAATTTSLGVLSTTTSSLVLGDTTTTGVDPPAPMGPTGIAFTTTSTSIDLPGGFTSGGDDYFPDIEITAVEVTQGIQDLQNRMPLVTGRRTVVRVYVAADKLETDGIGGLQGGVVEETIGPEGWEPVDGLLYLQRGGSDLILYPNNAPITAFRRGSDRLEDDETLNFDIPDGWLDGEVTMTAVVWSFLPESILTKEDDAGNNFAQGTVVFQEATEPIVVWFRLSAGMSDFFYESGMETATASYLEFHPLAVPEFWPVWQPLGPGPMIGDDEPSESWDFVEKPGEPNNRMRWLYSTWGLHESIRLHGLVDINTSSNWNGLTHGSLLVAWSKPNHTTPAHEGAHMYGIKHAPCKDGDDDGQPDELDGGPIDQTYPAGLPSCSIAPEDEAGYYMTRIRDTDLSIFSNDEALSNTMYPFMGYQSPKGVDGYHYCLLMETYGIGCNPGSIGLTPKTPPGAPVNCGPSQSGGFMLDLCLRDGVPDQNQVGDARRNIAIAMWTQPAEEYVLVDVDLGLQTLGHGMMLDPNHKVWLPANFTVKVGDLPGEPLGEFSFVIELAKAGALANGAMLRVTTADGHILAQIPVLSQPVGHQPVDGGPSVELVPWWDEAASLELLIDGEVVASKQPSAEPIITINPIEPPVSREMAVSWTATDPDGDDLLYSLFWSVDNGETWRVVDTGFSETEATVTDALVLAGGEVLIKVSASDGFSTGSAIAGPVTVPKGVPSGLIVAPETILQHSPERMTFHVYDPEDGVIRSGMWTSDLDGDLGEGRTMWTRFLSLGTHEISLKVRDGDGNVVTLTTEVEVVDSDISPPRVEGAVPDAETLVRLGPAALDQFPIGDSASGDESDPGNGFPVEMLVAAAAIFTLLGLGLVVRRARDQTR